MFHIVGHDIVKAKSGLDPFLDPFLDMTMPKMTGDVLTLEIKKINPHFSVIICTGFSEIMTPKRANSIGANGLLMKPVAGAEMARMVREVLDQSRLSP